ncbi:S8 family serine peptidase [Streptomyces sp. NPDC006012]|uniref:S8 family serine peptidase n=1 Tax=Streptomyces sp. NPDC006012 TaxID=3364739 RepID=UPI00367DC831
MTAAVLLALPGTPSSAAPTPRAVAAADSTAARPAARTVTLITGDKVTVTTAADGTVTRSLQDPRGQDVEFFTSTVGKDTYVYPASALPYVSSGQLDRGLFDVTRLLADGYDDAHTDKLPLIVSYGDASARSLASRVLPQGTTRTRTLRSINGAAVTESRAQAAGFWSSLTAGTARATATQPRLGAGIAKIWLDGKVKADLADTTAQIGAPEVWAGGDTGQGVDVAVLDTGIDTGHPDLTDRISASASFVPGEDIEDRFGHGTHVASTIAGTGAACDGKEKGVAPGARLHVGKILDAQGQGQDSWVLAGMEWAALDQRAKIINMSLGSGPGDGSDPLSQAVDTLSHETGALFAVAAGNYGPHTVSAPSVADAALSVGAVDGSDTLADFSSTGPRPGDGGLKPELTAPGVDVLAARSQYVSEGSGYYQTMSGTSMATPHVAGAAALLAEAHPGWTGQQLKDALVSTTAPTPKYTPYEAGSGRLDIAAAIRNTVFATGSVHGGYRSFSAPPGETYQKKVTYTNTGGSPVTLHLSVKPSAGTSPEVFSLSAPAVTVPANGTADVTLTTSFDTVQTGASVSGQILATDDAGTTVTHTVIGAYKDFEHYDLTVAAKDRRGRPLSGGRVMVTDGNTVESMVTDANGTARLTLTPGNYTVWLSADVEGTHGPRSTGFALLTAPEVVLDKDVMVDLDATKAEQVKVDTPRETTPLTSRVDVARTFDATHFVNASWLPPDSYDSVWALPHDEPVAQGTFEFGTSWRLAQPALTLASDTRAFDDLLVQPGRTPIGRGGHRYQTVYAGDGGSGAYQGLDARGKAVVVRRNDTVDIQQQADAAAAAGAALLVVVNDGAGRLQPWTQDIWSAQAPPPPAVTLATVTADEGENLIAQIQQRATWLRVQSHPTAEYLYDIVHHAPTIPKDPTYRPRPGDLARVDVSFRNNAPGNGREYRGDVWQGRVVGIPLSTPVQGDRTDWVSAGAEWREGAGIAGQLTVINDRSKHYPAGTRSGLEYFGPIQRPRMGDTYRPLRFDDQFQLKVAGWSDSGAGHIGVGSGPDLHNALTLYQGDTLVAKQDSGTMYVWGLSAEDLPYRLVSENSRSTGYSTATRTEWAFTSGRPAAGTQSCPALIQLDYTVHGMDDAGKAGRGTALLVTPSHLSGGPGSQAIDKVNLDVSYDDGATWHPAALQHTAEGWRTRLNAPAGARFVTLRTAARDTQGNSVTQAITRAFGLR